MQTWLYSPCFLMLPQSHKSTQSSIADCLLISLLACGQQLPDSFHHTEQLVR